MSGGLRHAARWIVSHPRLVIAGWAVALIVALPFAADVGSVLTRQGASKIVPGTTSAAVDRLVRESFPGGGDGESLLVVSAPDVRAPAVRRLLARLDARVGETTSRRAPVSKDARVALVAVRTPHGEAHDGDVERLRGVARDELRRAGLEGKVRVDVTGELALIHDTYAKSEADNGLMEVVALAIVGVVLLIFFRSLAAATLTLVVIGLALTVSQAALYVLGHHVPLTQYTVTITTFVTLGAGVDYSMLLSSRYRQERVAGRASRDALTEATVHAGETVLLAGAAVMLAFAATLLAPVEWIPPLGYGGMVAIPIVLLAALTLTPSIVALTGDRFFALGACPLRELEGMGLSAALTRLARFGQRRALLVTVCFVAATTPLAWLVATRETTADPIALSPATESRRGFESVARGWSSSELFPAELVGRLRSSATTRTGLTATGRRDVERLAAGVAAVPGVARVETVTRPFGAPLTSRRLDRMPAPAARAYLAPGGLLRVRVVLRDDPFSPEARATVRRLEAAAAPYLRAPMVGGATRVDEDYGHALGVSLWRMVALVAAGIFVLLVVALRSVLIPVRLIVTILMSNVWAIALTMVVFGVLGGQPIINDLPIFLIVLMMGLGMDYELFLVTRIRELRGRGHGEQEAVAHAVARTGRVITAAGLIMAGSLGAMTLSSTLMLQEYGLGLGAAVLFDATLVRLLLVPASLTLLHRYRWRSPALRAPAPDGITD
jgi:RND superfamily putative drug exporter